ncbi:FliM/FliN family flagellar motor switch protein [Legionella geestiana]|uniref:FliM/FliN family flagellar motor C-terminal domain-containing protein n=1 Tax=Legionella geestiana TaxID=45065 RepID=UPI001092E001|nr:FliM/FliN family flagellar motor C-terminal domain-containing protein [Legionella geestiana]QDQ39643.1 FliM/FliN family flagellar motor switch protein [Legionella geestiana]
MNAKPYRPDNHRARLRLTTHFRERLETWNKSSAHTCICCTVEPAGAPSEAALFLKDPRLLEDDAFLPLVRHAAFGEAHAAFDTAAAVLKECLINTLLAPLETALPTHMQDWFYKGSPAVCLRLDCGELQARLYPHPKLLADILRAPALPSLPEVAPDPRLKLEVRILDVRLPLQALRTLQPGDIIRSDTAIDAPVTITYGNRLLGIAAFGTCNGHPSIQLIRRT